MPDTDGLALAARIRERAELSATRIILLTSGDRPGDSARLPRAADRRPPAQAGPAGRAARDDLPGDEPGPGRRTDGRGGAGPGARPGAGSGHGAAAHPGGRGQRVQRAAPGATARPAGPPGAAGEQRPGGAGPGGRGRLRPAAPGRPHAGAGRLRGRPGDSGAGAGRGGTSARHRPDGAFAEGGPRALPGGRHGRLPGQAGSGRGPVRGHRPAGVRPRSFPAAPGGCRGADRACSTRSPC